MANVSGFNRRLIYILTQSPTYTASRSHPHRSALTWIRTITHTTSRSSQSSFTVSFGAENDAILAPHLQKLEQKEIKARSRKSGKFNARNAALTNTGKTDDFEIDDFVDLSASKSRSSRTEGAQMTTDTYLAPEQAYSRKRSVVERDSANFDKPSRKDGSISQRDVADRSTMKAALDSRAAPTVMKREAWRIQKDALKEKFGDGGWNPRKKLSPDAIEGIRSLHEQNPDTYSTSVLASQFKVSPEAIRRILKSNWSRNISSEKIEERRERWARRHDRIWDQQVELGLRPQRIKDRELEDPEQFEKDMERRRILGEI